MDFGFALLHELRVDELRQLAQHGEQLGFDYAWLPDQTFYQDPFVALGLIAESTSDIRLGIGVTNPYTRHPVQVARAIGTLAQAFPGRFSLGIGAGNRKELLTPLGLKQDRPARACKEAVIIMSGLLAGEAVTYHGDFFNVDAVRLELPLGPAPPLFIAGRGPATLQAAGEVADGVLIGGLVSPAGLEFAFSNLNKGLARSREDRAFPYTVSWVTCQLTDEVEAAMDSVRASIGHIIGGAPPLILEALQIDPERLTQLKADYEKGGPAAAAKHVTNDDIDLFSVIGTRQKLTEKLRELDALGVDQFSMLLWGATLAEATNTLEVFASEIMTPLRSSQSEGAARRE